VEIIPAKLLIETLQEIAVLWTPHTVRNVLQSDTWSLRGGVHHCFKRIITRKRT
jgi:hypothetical protein